MSRANTSRGWPRLPGPPDVSQGWRPRSAPSAGHAGRRPGRLFRKRWQPGWPTWKGRKAIGAGLSPPWPPWPTRPRRPPEARAGEHRPCRPALHPAGPRPGSPGSPGTPRPKYGCPTVSRPAPPSEAHLLRAAPPGHASGFSATRGAFPAPQPLGVRAAGPLPAPRPSVLPSRTAHSLRVRTRGVGGLREAPPRAL